MPHLDLKLRNIEVKRFTTAIAGPVNVHNNSTIKEVAKVEGKLSINFSYTCSYEPGIGLIKMEGDVIVQDSEENIEKAYREWEKSSGKGGKNLPTRIAEKVHNAILSSCMVESVIFSKEVGLPAPIPTPTVSLAKKEGQETKKSADTGSYIR
ncbi:MAG: hypothetical protein JW724_05505 [Candidatus Altiarchaeota archaeon]|nr:hypothetical protein [Candidatus Altiarchaeota archaeon]